jgi:hypothetical protein
MDRLSGPRMVLGSYASSGWSLRTRCENEGGASVEPARDKAGPQLTTLALAVVLCPRGLRRAQIVLRGLLYRANDPPSPRGRLYTTSTTTFAVSR